MKETNEKDVDDQVQAPDITDEKYKTYIDAGKRRIRLTKNERNSMRKHCLKNLLETSNVTHWAIKAMKSRKNKYNNLKHYKDCIGVRDETERLRLIAERADKRLSKVNEDDNSVQIMAGDELILAYRHCIHSLNIIQIAAPGVKLQDMRKTQIAITETDISEQLKEYFTVHMSEIKFLKSKMIYKVSPKIEDSDNISNEIQDNIDYISSASELIKSCFCIKFNIDKKNTCLIGNKLSRNIYITSPWEVRDGKLLPRKDNFALIDEQDLMLRRPHDVYTELPESLNGSKTGVEWLMKKIDDLKATHPNDPLT